MSASASRSARCTIYIRGRRTTDTVHHKQLEAFFDLPGAVRDAVHDIGLRRHRQHWHAGRRERGPRELHRAAVFGAGTRHDGGVVQSGAFATPAAYTFGNLDATPSTGPACRRWTSALVRTFAFTERLHYRASRRGVQRAEPFQLGHAQSFREHAPIRHHHGSHHSRARFQLSARLSF